MSRPDASAPTTIRVRRPTEADHDVVAGLVEAWWEGRRSGQLLPHLWLRHFAGTSWVAEEEDGRIIGFLIGFASPDRPDEAYVHLVGVAPGLRRRGLGRMLERRFADDVRARGVRHVRAVIWPGDRSAIAFHLALGYRPLEGSGSMRLYGTAAFPDYDGGEDRAVLVLDLP